MTAETYWHKITKKKGIKYATMNCKVYDITWHLLSINYALTLAVQMHILRRQSPIGTRIDA